MKQPKQYTKTTMLLRFLQGCKAAFIFSILASACVAGLEMITPQIIRIVVDYCLDNNPDSLPVFVRRGMDALGGRTFVLEHLYLAALAVVVVAVLTAGFRYLNTWLNAKGTEGMSKNARDWLFSHIEHLPGSWHVANQTGDIIQRCTSDVTSVRDFVSEQLVEVIRIVILILFSLIFMVSMSWKLSIVVLLSVPIIVGYSWFFFEKIGMRFLECDENEGILSTITQENLTGVRVVRAFARENYERERFRKQNVIYTDAWMGLCKLLAGFWASNDLLMAVQLMLIIVLGSILCVRGSITAGEMIAFISYNQKLTWPVRRLGRMISEMSKAGVSMDRLLYILNSKVEEDTLESLDEIVRQNPDLPAMTGDIEFSHVDFAYDKEKQILHDVSFRVPGGTTLGIMGTTGSGKSTLMYLLDRLYEPQSGEILVDGVRLSEISRPWVRSHVGMVLPEPYLFSRTIRENLEMGAASLTDKKKESRDEIPASNPKMRENSAIDKKKDSQAEMSVSNPRMEEAVAVAAMSDTIRDFAHGYDTMVGERGVTLSGGQKQRTAIARMLMQDTPIMIFDDSLSAVDAETDEKIRRELRRYMGHRTVILISHRISTLKEADQILVMDQGRIIQQGRHEELLAQDGYYQDIWELQHPKEEA